MNTKFKPGNLIQGVKPSGQYKGRVLSIVVLEDGNLGYKIFWLASDKHKAFIGIIDCVSCEIFYERDEL